MQPQMTPDQALLREILVVRIFDVVEKKFLSRKVESPGAEIWQKVIFEKSLLLSGCAPHTDRQRKRIRLSVVCITSS